MTRIQVNVKIATSRLTLAKLTVAKLTQQRIVLLLSGMALSPAAYAAQMVPWKNYLFGVMFISLVIASILSLRNPKADSRAGKLLLTGLYFWVFTFAQLIILALVYYFNK